ncbi:SgcJ/EcaC family oxidoreductase [Sciscionella sediminilitoris]|uniref:SgcJ/EcaC family oxidoreductase n=1 Tax=Sciscionella sediminilitoris TaxID=1445613 RepID=UPI0004DF89C3|nr:SgcJ/EcaC family oxidoreductase [Sciscionella sp. SE31]
MSIIEDVLGALRLAWDANDGAAWAASFTEDADFVDVLGRMQRGRETIAEEHQKIFDTIYRGSRAEFWPLSSYPLSGDGVSLAHTVSRLWVPSGPRSGVTFSVQTMVLERGLIRAFHNTIRADMADFAEHDEVLAAQAPLQWRQKTPPVG